MDAAASGERRAELGPESRQRVVDNIMNTLKKKMPNMGPEYMDELRCIVIRFEEKIFNTATDKTDYLKKISVKMMTMEFTQNAGITNQMTLNPANQNSPETGSHVLQSQVRNTGKSLPFPLTNQSQARLQTSAQGLQNNITSAALQGSAGLASALSYTNGSSQPNMSCVVNNLGQSTPQNIYANSQRQIQGRLEQHTITYQPQSLNPHLYARQLKQQQESLNTKLSHPSLLQSQIQQQQPLLAATQMPSSQSPLMQMSTSLQSSQSSLQQTQPPVMKSVTHSEHQQNQPNMSQQSPSLLLQQYPIANLTQQQPSQTYTVHQQASSLQQQPVLMSQQPVLSHQQLLGRQSNTTNLQQNQILDQQNSFSDIQHHQYMLAGQQNNVVSLQMPPQANMSLHQQVATQSSMSGLHQLEALQHMEQHSHPLGLQRNISNMQQYQQAMHIMHPQKPAAQQQQFQQAAAALIQSQGEQAHAIPAQQQLMPQIQNQTGKFELKMLTQQQQQNHLNHLEREMQPIQPRLQASGGLLQPQNANEQQKPAHQSQSELPEASPDSMGPVSGTGHVVPDWQEGIYQKIQSMKGLYYADLAELHLKVALQCQQLDAQIPPGKQSEQLEKFKQVKISLHHMLTILQMPKRVIEPIIKERLPHWEKQMVNVITSIRRKNASQSQGQPQFPHPAGDTESMPQPSHAPSQQHDKHGNEMPSLDIQGNIEQQRSIASNQPQLLADGTTGISASPMLAEYTGSDATQGNALADLCDESIAIETPIERLVKAVQSSSPKVLISSVSDIGSTVSMIDSMAGSVPGNGSHAAAGEDLAATTKCHLHVRNLILQDGSGATTKKRKCHSRAMPLSALLSAGCVNENQQSGQDMASASWAKRQKIEENYLLLEEIREINLELIDTMVNISDEDVEGGEGVVVKCSYCAVAVCPNLKSLFSSTQLSPIVPLRLLIPTSYPNSSPVLLDKMSVESSKELEDLSAKVKSRFSRSLRGISQPMSLGEMVRTWDICARKVIEDYTLRFGGGSFSSRYGGWENCVTA